MRASPQCHDLPLQPAHAVVLKFLHGLYVLVAGTDSRVHLLRIPCTAPWRTPCRPTTQCDSRVGFNLPSVLQRPIHMVRQPVAARTSTAACATVAQVCHTFSSPPASAAACILCASSHSTVRTPVLVHRAAWISNRFQLAIRLAPVHAHGSAATRTLNHMPWTARVQTIAANSPHRNARQGNRLSRAVRPSKPRSYAQRARHSAHQLA